MYACPNCGANIKFDPGTQMMKCPYCDTEIAPFDYMHAKSADEEKGIDPDAQITPETDPDEYEVTYYTCPQCGGELITEDTTAATFCSYCGASTILEMRVGKEKKPDYIIPFKKTRDDCVKAYKKTVSRAIFAPSYLKKDETIERFRGIYMPYWIYDVSSNGKVTAKGSTSTRRGDYIYTKNYDVSADVETVYRGISYDASSSFEDRLSEAIGPFDLNDSEHFSSSFFSGFYADTSDVEPEIYNEDVKNLVLNDAASIVYTDPAFRKHGVSMAGVVQSLGKRRTTYRYKRAMFPVWFLSNQNEDRVSYAVVNGQTGKVAMDIPIDAKKFFIGTLVLAIPICVLLLLTKVLIGPRLLIGITMIISLIVLILANSQSNALFAREILFTDKGYNSKRTPEEIKETQKLTAGNVVVKKAKIKPGSGSLGIGSAIGFGVLGLTIGTLIGKGLLLGLVFFIAMIIVNAVNYKRVPKDKIIVKCPVSRKIGITIFPIITMVIGALIFMIHPYEDMFYYGTAILGMVMTGYTVVRLVMRHNQLSSRKLPQFNKRGGEEHEND